MNEALITSQGGVLAVMATTVAISFGLQKYKPFKNFGPALLCIIMGLILSNLNIVPNSHPIYLVFFTYAIPVGLSMFLISVDIKQWIKMSKQPLLAMFFAIVSVSVIAIIMGLIFAPKIDEGWKIAGMFVGTYTGGSPNLTAIGTGLNVLPTTFASANAADYVIGMPLIILFFALPAILKKAKWFKKAWPYRLEEEELEKAGEDELFAKKQWSINDIATLFAIGFIVTSVATVVSQLFDPAISGSIRIILVTTLSIIIGQFKFTKKINGNMDLGVYIALFFLVIIGFSIDINHFLQSAPLITLYCFSVIAGSLLLHLILCRLFKIKYQYVLISIVAAIADGGTAALVAGSARWKAIMSMAIVLGAMGMAFGNYIGIGVAYLLKMIIGA